MVKTSCFQCREVQVQSLGRELRFHMSHSVVKKKKKLELKRCHVYPKAGQKACSLFFPEEKKKSHLFSQHTVFFWNSLFLCQFILTTFLFQLRIMLLTECLCMPHPHQICKLKLNSCGNSVWR